MVASATFWLIVRSSSFVDRAIRALSCSRIKSGLGAFGKAIRSIASLTHVARARNVPTAAGYWVAQAWRAAVKAALLSGGGCAGLAGSTGLAVDRYAGGGVGGAMQWLKTAAQTTSPTMSNHLMSLPWNVSARLAQKTNSESSAGFSNQNPPKACLLGKCNVSAPLRKVLNPFGNE